MGGEGERVEGAIEKERERGVIWRERGRDGDAGVK